MIGNKYIAALIVVLVVVGGYFLMQGLADKAAVESVTTVAESPASDVVTSQEGNESVMDSNPNLAPGFEVHTVMYTEKGFEPNEITINTGDRVVWINSSKEDMQPASALHPSHTKYPGTDAKKCAEGTEVRAKNFDACIAIHDGEAYSFIFNEVGAWGYHDHLNPDNTAVVIVQ